MNPCVSGATTTATPGVPGATSSTGVWTPCSASVAANRVAPPPVAAHTVTAYPSATSRDTPDARRAGSPATGSKRRTPSAGIAGPSGTGGIVVTGAGHSRSKRSKGTCRRGKASSSPSFAPHGRGQRLGQRRLFVEQLRPPVPYAPRLDEQHLPARRQQVRQDALGGLQEGQPRLHAVELVAAGQTVPHRRPPGPARPQDLGRGAQLLGQNELATAIERDGVEIARGALVAHGERSEAVHLVTPQVDAHRFVGRRREHVDDASAHGELAAVLHLVLASVAERHQLGQEHIELELVAGTDHHGGELAQGAEPLEQCSNGRHDHRGGRGGHAATPCGRSAHRERRAAAPSSRPPG